jgi:hypothetical protein
MKLEIVVPSQTTSTEIQELAEMISAGLGGVHLKEWQELASAGQSTEGLYLSQATSGNRCRVRGLLTWLNGGPGSTRAATQSQPSPSSSPQGYCWVSALLVPRRGRNAPPALPLLI